MLVFDIHKPVYQCTRFPLFWTDIKFNEEEVLYVNVFDTLKHDQFICLSFITIIMWKRSLLECSEKEINLSRFRTFAHWE